eukprot:4661242-Alexandrium_andersonii.AAC.1
MSSNTAGFKPTATQAPCTPRLRMHAPAWAKRRGNQSKQKGALELPVILTQVVTVRLKGTC